MAADRDRPRPASLAHPPARLPPEEESGTVVAFLGGSTRKGSWEPPALLRVLAFMGGVELDFREADLLEGETVLEILDPERVLGLVMNGTHVDSGRYGYLR